jgi:predicted nucleotidyltransferase
MEKRIMVRGIEIFKAHLRRYEKNYAIIGGTACDILMSEAGNVFRATRDIDMVLIIEEMKADFGAWKVSCYPTMPY